LSAGTKLERFREHVRRHGVRQTAVTYGCAVLRKLVDFEVLRVETIETGPPLDASVEDCYVTREVEADEFFRDPENVGEGRPGRDAFDAGDRCFANLLAGTIVGYTFYGTRATRIRPGLILRVPEGTLYSYASYTQPAHRGKRLAFARSNARRQVDLGKRTETRVIWYVAVDNARSRASIRVWDSELVGYVGYARVGRRFLLVASRGCRRAGVELEPG
jgi:hypothetical protein